ncbi:MAG: extracellular solute-binding protein [Thaumarchaeota archaeon]|nr:extracellular solute-binding protein [Nitrososphaerota archaeon]
MTNVVTVVSLLALILAATSMGYASLTVSQETNQLREEIKTADRNLSSLKKDVSDLSGGLQSALQEAKRQVDEREALLKQITPFDPQLVSAAIKEGSLTIYSNRDQNDLVILAQEFQKKFPGIKVSFLTATTTELISKASTEMKASQSIWDILDLTASSLAVVVEAGATQPYKSSQYTKENFPFIDPKGHIFFHGSTINAVIYNPNLVKRSDLEGVKTWEDLPSLAAKYPGKILVHHPSRAGPGTLILAELKAYWNDDAKWNKYLDQIKALNPRMFRSTGEIGRLVISEEGAIGIPGLLHDVLQAKENKVPLEYIPLTPLILNPSGSVISKNAPHPNAAKLLIEYMLSPDGQELFSRAYRSPLRLGFVSKSSLNVLFPGVTPDKMIGISNQDFLSKPSEFVKKYLEPVFGPS